MRQIFALFIFFALTNAALDQLYVQNVYQNGTSTIVKTMDLSIFSKTLTQDAFSKMQAFCSSCEVDKEHSTITISESFDSGDYYTLKSDYGLPFITHTLTINKIPTDRFSTSLEKILLGSGAAENIGGNTVSAIDLKDSKNAEGYPLLKALSVNITYRVNMPGGIDGAASDAVLLSSSSAQFDVVEALKEPKTITIVSRELNLGYIIGLIGIIVLAALAASFVISKPAKK